MSHENFLGSLQYARGAINTAERFLMNFPEDFHLFMMRHDGATITFKWECENPHNGHPYKIDMTCGEDGTVLVYLDLDEYSDWTPMRIHIYDLDESWYNHNLANFRKV